MQFMSSNCWDRHYNERKYVNIDNGLYYTRQIAGSGEIGHAHYCTHVPLQVLGNMLTRRTKDRIQSREDK